MIENDLLNAENECVLNTIIPKIETGPSGTVPEIIIKHLYEEGLISIKYDNNN